MPRAGPSNVATKLSPAVPTSRPRNAVQLLSDDDPMLLEERCPADVSQAGRLLGRADDVGEEDGGEYPVDRSHRWGTGEELLDLVNHPVGVARPVGVPLAGQLDISGAGKVLGQVPAVLDADNWIAAAVDDQHRALDRRQHVTDIEVVDHPQHRQRHTGARPIPFEAAVPLAELRVCGQLRGLHLQPGWALPHSLAIRSWVRSRHDSSIPNG